MYKKKYIAVAIPCYMTDINVTIKIINKIPFFVDKIILIDDACPFKTGEKIKKKIKNLEIIFNKKNIGVGGSVMKAYKKVQNKNGYIFKIDGDGQMDPKYIKSILEKMINRNLDYIKGNRFKKYKILFNQMPLHRIFGNYILSYLSQISSNYKNIFDCTNGYTCLNLNLVNSLPLNKIHKRFFFEIDMLHYLFSINAKIQDFYMPAYYGKEKSNLNLSVIIPQFSFLLLKNFLNRKFK